MSKLVDAIRHLPRLARARSRELAGGVQLSQDHRNLDWPGVAYHWAPASCRNSILRRGLQPGSLSRNRKARWPFVSLSSDARFAYDSANSYQPITEPMDLWTVDLFAALGERDYFESLQHNTDNDTAEVRVYTRIPARHIWLAGTREPEEA